MTWLVEREVLIETIKRYERVIERLDEAMATPERIAQDTDAVGGFVSTLNLTETAEDILERAIQRLGGSAVKRQS